MHRPLKTFFGQAVGFSLLEDLTGMNGDLGRPRLPAEESEWTEALNRAGGQQYRALLCHVVGSQDEVDDILQDVCEQFLLHRRANREVSPGWIRAVGYSLARRVLRRNRRYQDEAPPELSTASTITESQVQWDEAEDALRTALRALPSEQLQLIKLRFWEGLKIREIATQLGTSVNGIERRLHRVLKRLDGLLSGNPIPEDRE